MVGTGRFELPTPRTPSECSTRLSHVPTSEEEKHRRFAMLWGNFILASASGSQWPRSSAGEHTIGLAKVAQKPCRRRLSSEASGQLKTKVGGGVQTKVTCERRIPVMQIKWCAYNLHSFRGYGQRTASQVG